MDFIAVSKDSMQCYYGANNRDLLHEHLFSVLLLLPVTYLLLYNKSLRLLYLPLARLVNVALILRYICVFLFLSGFPYYLGSSNCYEIVLSRVNTMVEMFAELHQIYFIAYAIGVGNIYFAIVKMHLTQVLKLSVLLTVVVLLLSFVLFRNSLTLVEDVCTVFVSAMQIYIIRCAENLRYDELDNFVVHAKESSVSTFKNLSIIQLFLSSVCLAYKIVTLLDRSTIGSDWDLSALIGNVDFFCTYLFFLKVILIKEKAKNVAVEIVSA